MKRLGLLLVALLCVGALASPVAAQQTGTPTDDGTTPEETETLPLQSPSGSPVSYESPTPTSSGSGPGFGVAVALVAGLVGAGFAVHRRT
ncbi:hypothetical protein [Haloarcula onubensis]|uniref:PGF-CTERM sorting domain-containing protein n=1 Tax=Haloarcula onubensis TaxID=2950539 RepID=A0ABU2FMQ5_9EURY|nr:hypothetical protein [Halomicroarcula sp. S3CR25-11]MDS0282043.1 hypothetical protein [Halomicroarcula sp. S3CR25-11]